MASPKPYNVLRTAQELILRLNLLARVDCALGKICTGHFSMQAKPDMLVQEAQCFTQCGSLEKASMQAKPYAVVPETQSFTRCSSLEQVFLQADRE